MKLLIIRTHGSVVNLNTYNSQDLGMARAMLQKGIQCDIVYFGGKEKTHIQEIDTKEGKVLLYWVKGISLALNGIFFGLGKIVNQYDVIQVGDYDQFTSIWYAFFSRYRKKVVLYHGPYLCDYNRKYRMKCRLIDSIPLSKKIKESLPCFAKSILAEDFLRDRGFRNITTVGVGLDTERFDGLDTNPSPDVENILKRTNDHPFLLYVGLLEPRRNTKFLIELLAELNRNAKDLSLVLIGRGEEEYKSQVFELAKSLGVSDNVLYLESLKQSQLPFLYRKAAMFLLPSSYEIFGMVLMEAMYYEIPVITTQNGGSLTLIDSASGIVCDLDINEWKEQIIRILRDAKYRKQIGINGKKMVEEKCSWDVITSKMIKNYPTMIKNKTRS